MHLVKGKVFQLPLICSVLLITLISNHVCSTHYFGSNIDLHIFYTLKIKNLMGNTCKIAFFGVFIDLQDFNFFYLLPIKFL